MISDNLPDSYEFETTDLSNDRCKKVILSISWFRKVRTMTTSNRVGSFLDWILCRSRYTLTTKPATEKSRDILFDTCAFIIGKDNVLLESIYYGNTKDKLGTILHCDKEDRVDPEDAEVSDLAGKESIFLNLENVRRDANRVFIAMYSHSGISSLSSISKLSIELRDGEDKYNVLKELPISINYEKEYTGAVIGCFHRKESNWILKPLMETNKVTHIIQLKKEICRLAADVTE